MAQQKKFTKVWQIDALWIAQQDNCVKTLYLESIAADPWGEKFVELDTSLEERSFRRARKILMEAGYFEYDYERSILDGRRTNQWMVRNLHGSETDFWLE